MEFSVEYSITKIFDSYSPSEDSKNVRALDMALDATSSGSPVHCSVPVTEPPQQGDWGGIFALSAVCNVSIISSSR